VEAGTRLANQLVRSDTGSAGNRSGDGQDFAALLQRGPFAKPTAALLKTARRYPEGTAFSFNRRRFAPNLILALIAAKIAH